MASRTGRRMRAILSFGVDRDCAAAAAQWHALVYRPVLSRKRRNSARVRASSRKPPSIFDVTMLTPRLWMPRVVMHSWVASTTTPTPRGLSTPSITVAICARSEEHTSELQSLMRISYAVFCLKNKTHQHSRRNATQSLHALIEVDQKYHRPTSTTY